jgi:hypothetical protein
MSSIGRALSGGPRRLFARQQADRADYAFCAKDRYWFRPSYTEGKCPLCGEPAPRGAGTAPLWARAGRSWYGLAVLALESLGMLTLVLFMYFKG